MALDAQTIAQHRQGQVGVPVDSLFHNEAVHAVDDGLEIQALEGALGGRCRQIRLRVAIDQFVTPAENKIEEHDQETAKQDDDPLDPGAGKEVVDAEKGEHHHPRRHVVGNPSSLSVPVLCLGWKRVFSGPKGEMRQKEDHAEHDPKFGGSVDDEVIGCQGKIP